MSERNSFFSRDKHQKPRLEKLLYNFRRLTEMGSTQSNTNWSAQGKHVLITGSSSGIGAEMARNFAQQGASLALVARSKEGLAAVAQECRKLGAAKVETFPCDVTKNKDIQMAIQNAVHKFGKFDVLFLNAGRSQGCYFEEIKDVDSIDYMLTLNINGVINTVFYALPSVPKSSASRIVVIGSVSGLFGVPYRSIYCASKHALTGFTNTLRIELNDTYGKNAPRVQLINFPEVSGTKLNSGRMDFGAELPPIEFIVDDARIPPVEKACKQLMKEIEKGSNEWGQPFKARLVVLLRSVFAAAVDILILKTVKKTHRRPNLKTDAK